MSVTFRMRAIEVFCMARKSVKLPSNHVMPCQCVDVFSGRKLFDA